MKLLDSWKSIAIDEEIYQRELLHARVKKGTLKPSEVVDKLRERDQIRAEYRRVKV